MTSVTRRYYFSASHRLHLRDLSEAENEQLYGKCNNPYGHGHDYVLDVTAQGTVDPVTGQVVTRHELDRLVREQILNVFEHRNINLDVQQFENSVPTTENIALVIADLLREQWSAYVSSPACLSRIHIQETDRNGFEVLIPSAQGESEESREPEVVGVHG
jgi:6-pyruvoyltetrahydropterin/6-carboxytetrahydropterin synthase